MTTEPAPPGASPIPVVVIESGHAFPWVEFWLITVPTVLLALVTLHADHEAFQMVRLILARLAPPYRGVSKVPGSASADVETTQDVSSTV